MKTSTVLALVCFAANSLLCRQALASGDVDAASFTSVRLVSGALVLWVLARGRPRVKAGVVPAVALLVYATCFSFAYVELTAASGALILFASVQVTMLVGAVFSGERLSPARWTGVAVALAGVGYLLAPGVAAPSLSGALLMLASGVAWGLYSLLGRSSGDPLASTSRHFLMASVPALVLSGARFEGAVVSPAGFALAVSSGALASGVGYALWFSALKKLTSSAAAVVQLAVPCLAALGGVAFLAEPISGRLLIASAIVLGGIALALNAPSRTTRDGTSAGAPESRPEGCPRAAHPRGEPASTV